MGQILAILHNIVVDMVGYYVIYNLYLAFKKTTYKLNTPDKSTSDIAKVSAMPCSLPCTLVSAMPR